MIWLSFCKIAWLWWIFFGRWFVVRKTLTFLVKKDKMPCFEIAKRGIEKKWNQINVVDAIFEVTIDYEKLCVIFFIHFSLKFCGNSVEVFGTRIFTGFHFSVGFIEVIDIDIKEIFEGSDDGF